MSTTTITGTIHGVNNTALANKWINFRLAQLGTDAVASVTVAESVDSVQTDANGNFSIDVWNNGDSGTISLLEIAVEGSDTQYVVMPKDVASIELWDLIENYQAAGNTSQVPIVSDLFLRKSTNLGDVPNKILASQNLNLAIGTNVQAHSSVLDATDAIFTVSKDAAISENTAKTGTNETNIAINAAAIALNTTKTETNETNIATNVAAIANNTAKTENNETNIATNVAAIANNTIKVGITTTQAAAIVDNSAKVSNATHTGDVTGDTALTIADNTVTVAKISASGVPNATTFLSGAGTWSTPTSSGGDMSTAVYDPQLVQGNAFDMANMEESISAKILTQSERNLISQIPDNTLKIGITQAQADAIVSNTNKIPNALTTGTPSTTTFLNGANQWAVPAGSGGGGDMLSSVYDPTLVEGDTFDMDNMVEGTNNKILTPQERAEIIANTNKVGITTTQANEIIANTNKVGITTTQANEIIANSAKVTNASHFGDVIGDQQLTLGNGVVGINNLSASLTPNITKFLRGDNVWERVGVNNINSTGTPSSTTYLRGDATWSTAGDMFKAIYDPLGANRDAFTMNNMLEGVNAKILTETERTEIAANTLKVTNANHTGDVTGSEVLTIADGAVDLAMLSAGGSPTAGNFLRGDNTWAPATQTQTTANIENAEFIAETTFTDVFEPTLLEGDFSATNLQDFTHSQGKLTYTGSETKEFTVVFDNTIQNSNGVTGFTYGLLLTRDIGNNVVFDDFEQTRVISTAQNAGQGAGDQVVGYFNGTAYITLSTGNEVYWRIQYKHAPSGSSAGDSAVELQLGSTWTIR